MGRIGIEQDNDEDYGLPIIHNQQQNRINRYYQDSDNTTGFDDIDNENLDSATPTPQDPYPSTGITGIRGYEQLKFQEFIEELIYTLASKFTGYSNLNELKADFSNDTGYMPDIAVQYFGFANFEAMMNSDRMAKYIGIQLIDDKLYFLPKDCSRFSHIRDAQEIARNATLNEMDDEEREKMKRAYLPQNFPKAIEGRRRISEILYELDGERKEVLWQDIQKKYREKYNVELAGKELKEFFQRDKALGIIHTLFEKEVQTFTSNAPGQFFLKLKMPYHELVEYYNEQMRTQSEATTMLKSTRRDNGNPQASRCKENHPIGPMFPQNQEADQILQVGTSTGITGNGKFAPQRLATPSNAAPVHAMAAENPPNVSLPILSTKSAKSKFDYSEAHPKSVGEFLSRDEPEAGGESISNDRIQWNEEGEYVDAYQIEPNQSTKANQDSNNVPQKKQNASSTNANNKYTTCANQDFTDSEEECEDDASVMGMGGGTRPTMSNAANSTLPAPAAFTPAVQPQSIPHMGVHQKNIHGYLAQQNAAKKKTTTPSSNTTVPAPTSATTNSTRPSTVQQIPPNPAHPSSLPNTIRDQPTPSNAVHNHRPIPNNIAAPSIVSQNSTMLGCPAAEWTLLNHAGHLCSLAEKLGISHKTCSDEGSFTFRSGNKLLVLTEYNDKIRASVHQAGSGILTERYYPKVDLEMFLQAVWGILSDTFAVSQLTPQTDRMLNNFDRDDSFGCGSPFNAHDIRSEDQHQDSIWDDSAGWGSPPKAYDLMPADQHQNSIWDDSAGWGCPPSEEAISQWRPGQIEASEQMTDIDTNSSKQWGCPPTKTAIAAYEETAFRKRQKPRKDFHLPPVPDEFRTREPPFPACCLTVDGREFLAFFTKIYGFSNHFTTKFQLDGVTYCCSEQYYMFQKATEFGFHEVAREIMATTNSSKIKELGTADTFRQRKADGLEPYARVFDHDEWRVKKPNVMMNALKAKFEQNIFLFNMLLDTQDAYLVEASSSDYFWGIGCSLKSHQIRDTGQWRGANRLGTLLMELRSQFRIAMG